MAAASLPVGRPFTDRQITVLIAVLRLREKERCWPSDSAVAREMGIASHAYVARARRKLEFRGHLPRTGRG